MSPGFTAKDAKAAKEFEDKLNANFAAST